MRWSKRAASGEPGDEALAAPERSEEGGDENLFMCWDTKTNSVKPLPYPWDDDLEPALMGTYEVAGMQCPTGLQALWESVEEFTLEKAAEICWLDADKIEEAIKIYVDGPGGISLGVATDQHPSSSVCAMCACMLNLIMGYVGKPGCLLQSFGMGPNSEAMPFRMLRNRGVGSQGVRVVGGVQGFEPQLPLPYPQLPEGHRDRRALSAPHLDRGLG